MATKSENHRLTPVLTPRSLKKGIIYGNYLRWLHTVICGGTILLEGEATPYSFPAYNPLNIPRSRHHGQLGKIVG